MRSFQLAHGGRDDVARVSAWKLFLLLQRLLLACCAETGGESGGVLMGPCATSPRRPLGRPARPTRSRALPHETADDRGYLRMIQRLTLPPPAACARVRSGSFPDKSSLQPRWHPAMRRALRSLGAATAAAATKTRSQSPTRCAAAQLQARVVGLTLV